MMEATAPGAPPAVVVDASTDEEAPMVPSLPPPLVTLPSPPHSVSTGPSSTPAGGDATDDEPLFNYTRAVRAAVPGGGVITCATVHPRFLVRRLF